MHLRAILILFLLLPVLQPFSRSPCKPKFKGNKGHRFALNDLLVESHHWEDRDEPGTSISQFYKAGYDSVATYRNGHPAGGFLVRGNRILSDRFVRTDASGHVISIDSFRVSTGRPEESYFDSYEGSLRVRREYYPTGIPSKVIYRDSGNWTTGYIQWSPTGTIDQRMQDGTIYQYSGSGILAWQQQQSGSEHLVLYYESGVIRSVSRDTLVNNQIVQYVCDYSPRGILLMEKWFKDKKPCETWHEYSAEGVLVKTIRHTPLVQLPIEPEVAEVMDGTIIAYAEETAEYSGGPDQFMQQMELGLPAVFCSSTLPLTGQYKIRFSIGEDGTPAFLSVEGENAGGISQSEAAQFIGHFAKWWPARHAGRPVAEVKVLVLDLEEW